jgi:hypothetical protein
MEAGMNQDATSGDRAPSHAVVMPLGDFPTYQSNDAIQLDSCPQFERIRVKTRSSVYDVIVLCGGVGDVLVRGGRFFPEFRRVRLAGSTAGGTALKLRSISVGFRMELHFNGESVVTSRVQTVSRDGLHHAEDEGALWRASRISSLVS